MPSPNKERLRLWMEDLRTTDRSQGHSRLRSSVGDCCLGRACEVYRTHTGRGEWSPGGAFLAASGPSSAENLPAPVARWFGISDDDPTLIDHQGARRHATAMNDHYRATFGEIADAIGRRYRLEGF